MSMPKLIFIIMMLLLLIPILGFSADQPTSKSLTFSWEQTVDLDYINGWTLYVSPTAGAGYVKVVDIPYVPGSGQTFTTTTALSVTGTPGATVNRYFVLQANGKGGLNSVYSNEASFAFVIPFPTPGAPFNLTITVTVTS